MGTATVSMHYTAMAAARLTPSANPPGLTHAVSISALGMAGMSGGPVMVLVTLFTCMVDRLQKKQTLQDQLFDQAPDAVALASTEDLVIRGTAITFLPTPLKQSLRKSRK
jgi:hypothetical protein